MAVREFLRMRNMKVAATMVAVLLFFSITLTLDANLALAADPTFTVTKTGMRVITSDPAGTTYRIVVGDAGGAMENTFTLALELVDDVAPDTRITQGPDDGSATSNTSVTFTFGADEPGSTFKCRVYPAALTPPAFDNCSGAGTPTASGFSPGTYSFEVRATDAAGNSDETSAKRTFSIDTTLPNTTITSGPSGTLKSTSASFGFTSTESNSTFQCSLDGAAFTSCASPKSYTNLKNGPHTFKVRAIDRAGNTDATPAVRSWTVDTTPLPLRDTIRPTIKGMVPKHRSTTRDTTPTIKATVKDNLTNLKKSNIKLYVSGKRIASSKFKYSASTDKLTYNSPKLSKGKKTVKVVARDAAGNVGARS